MTLIIYLAVVHPAAVLTKYCNEQELQLDKESKFEDKLG